MSDTPTPPVPPSPPGTGRYTGRLFLDGADAALFLRQHGDMVAAVERMATATELVASSTAGLADRVHRLESDAQQERGHAGADIREIRDRLAEIDGRFRFWPMVGRFGALLIGFGVVALGTYELVRAVL